MARATTRRPTSIRPGGRGHRRQPRALAEDRTSPWGGRTDRDLYVEYSSGDRELDDMKRDPFQLQSRHADPAYLPTWMALEAAARGLRRNELCA